jgi:hypothetical protein
MADITAKPSPFNFPSDSNLNSGKFIPWLWSAKMNAKFYAASVFGEIANTDWEGEISGIGDKIVINNVPDVTIKDYTGDIGTATNPPPSTIDLNISKAKFFHFNINDVLAHQSKPKLMSVFSDNAAQRMKMFVDSNVIYNSFATSDVLNKGATAGVRSASYNLGLDTLPIVLTAANVLQTITALGGVLDEQNVPDSDRWLVIDPLTRQLLMYSNLAQAQFMGDNQSMVRNGKIGMIDRFTVYVSNQLPTAASGATVWTGAQDGTGNVENTISCAVRADGGTTARRPIIAGHKAAIAFASQITKVESLRNPNQFGDLVRGLNVFGYNTVKPESMATAIVAA